MNRQNKGKHYHSFSMGKQDSRIHDLLSPVIETVRSNKINSFFQLKNKLQDETPNPSFIFQPYVATPANRQAKMYMTMYNSHRSPKHNPEMSPRTAGSPTRTSNCQRKEFKPPSSHSHQQKKLFRINSKIKKHLVEEIDFDQIEKMLYKKRDCVTQYEHYLQIKSDKNKKIKQFSVRKHQSNASRKQNKEISPIKYENDISMRQSFYQTLPVRQTNKKRLWIKDKNRRNKSAVDGWLCPVEGHSFSTIQQQ